MNKRRERILGAWAAFLLAASSIWCAERILRPVDLVPLTFTDYKEALTQPDDKSKGIEQALRASLAFRAFAYFKAEDFRALMLFAGTWADAPQRRKARDLVSDLLWNWTPRLQNRDAQRLAFRKVAHELLTHADARLRALALREMACFADDSDWAQAFQSATAQALNDPCPDVRRTALIAHLDTRKDVPTGFLEDPDSRIRAISLEAMARKGHATSAELARKYLSNADRSGELEVAALPLARLLCAGLPETSDLFSLCAPLLSGTPTQHDNTIRLLLHTAHVQGKPEDNRLLDHLLSWEDYSPADCRLILKIWPVMDESSFNGDRWETIARADDMRKTLMSLLGQERQNTRITVAEQ